MCTRLQIQSCFKLQKAKMNMFATQKTTPSKQRPSKGVSRERRKCGRAPEPSMMNKILDILGIRKALHVAYRKFGKKALYIFLVYFIAKWTLTLLFGAKILAFLRDIF